MTVIRGLREGLRLTYKTKLIAVFLGVAVVTNAISLFVMDRLSVHYLYEGYRAKMLSITDTAGTMLNGDLLRNIQTRDDEKTPAWSQLRDTLRRVRDANRRPDTFMKRMFAVVRSKDDPRVLVVAVDPEEDPQLMAHAGEAYRPGANRISNIEAGTVEENFITDEFGTFLRSWSPVRDSAGNVAGAVIVEAPIGWVESRMTPIRLSGLGSMAIAVLIAIPAALIVSRKASQPLTELQSAVARIGAGDFD
ncbi:MAG TPA: hypothetical protein VHA14_06190, partial [Bryobacteraceae bacterium]|nr:hypothetical protein [Bryobacteraceae bacterium]